MRIGVVAVFVIIVVAIVVVVIVVVGIVVAIVAPMFVRTLCISVVTKVVPNI